MKYKTMVLELLANFPRLQERLRKKRKLMQAMETYAMDLKLRHESWKERLSQENPGSDPLQIASEALEMALQELEKSLSSNPLNQSEPFSLDDAMAFICHQAPRR